MSGSFKNRHHVEPRVKLYSPREESFPIPLKYIDVTRTTHTNLDVKQERRIDDYWNIDGSRDLSDPWTGFTQFTLLDEKAPDGFLWSGGKQLTSRPDHLKKGGPVLWSAIAMCEMSKTWQMSKHCMKGDLEHQRLNIIRFLRETSQGSTKLQSVTWNIPWMCVFRGEEFGKVILWLHALRSWKFLDASEFHARRLNAKEVITPFFFKKIFPIADGTTKLTGRDHGILKSTLLMPNQPVRSGDLQGSSDKSQPVDETTHDAEARNDFWSIEGDFIYRHRIQPRLQLCVPKE